MRIHVGAMSCQGIAWGLATGRCVERRSPTIAWQLDGHFESKHGLVPRKHAPKLEDMRNGGHAISLL